MHLRNHGLMPNPPALVPMQDETGPVKEGKQEVEEEMKEKKEETEQNTTVPTQQGQQEQDDTVEIKLDAEEGRVQEEPKQEAASEGF